MSKLREVSRPRVPENGGFLKHRLWTPYFVYYPLRLLLTSLSLIIYSTTFMLTTHNYTSPLRPTVKLNTVTDIDRWMTNNKPKLNKVKTELLFISSKYRSRPMVTSIKAEVETIKHQSFVRNLGVILDHDIEMDKHIDMICKTSQNHLRNIRNIRKFLDQGSAETWVQSFVTSKIDFSDALLFGLPKYHINRLQLVLNTAARVIGLARKYDHISAVKKSLPWLHVSQCLTLTIFLLIPKAFNGLASIYLSDLLAPLCYVRSRDCQKFWDE